MKIPLIKNRFFGFAALGAFVFACSSSSSSTSSAPIMFQGQIQPLSGFSYDTGLEPSVSPAQAEIKLSANGNISVASQGTVQNGKLVPTAGTGNVSLDVHFVLAGHLKVTSTLENYDGDIPGLSNIDIEAKGSSPFDPFLIGGNATVSAPIPATDLPDVPLGTVPGNLKLSIGDGSSLTTVFQGTCASTQNGSADYQGTLTTSGTLVLKATIALSLPPPLDKSVDLPDITVNIPATTTPIDLGPQPAAGASDATQGTCSTIANDGGTGDAGSGSDSGNPANDAGSDSGTCAAAGGSCNFLTTPLCCSGFCDVSPSTAAGTCAANQGAYSLSIDGKAQTITSVVGGAGNGEAYTLYIYFSGAGLGPGTRIVVGMNATGSGCGPSYVQYQPDNGTGITYADDGAADCGLNVTSVPPSVAAATFNGTLSQNGSSVQVVLNASQDVQP